MAKKKSAKKTRKSVASSSARKALKHSAWYWGIRSFFLTLTLIGVLIALYFGRQTFVDDGADHLAYGKPAAGDYVIRREGYVLGYSQKDVQPYWVIYHLTAKQLTGKKAERSNVFMTDTDIPGNSATPDDYKKSGYDRGHLAPAADMAYSEKTMRESFYMSNMSPQLPGFNRGVWKDLETQVRHFAETEKDIFVITGPVLGEKFPKTIGKTKSITVPEYFYKVVYDRTPPEKMIAFLLPNAASDKSLQSFALSVDALEAVTGLDFFSEMAPEKQNRLESVYSVSDWKWQKFKRK